MMEHIQHKGKIYPIKEVTIKMWSEIMKNKEFMDEEELYYKMISEMCGLSREMMNTADASTIIKVGEQLKKILEVDSKKLYPEIEHNGKKYKLVDVHNMSFGQFVDIDTFLTKDENYRISNLSELASYLYTEEGRNYGQTDFKKQKEEFQSLPIKYVEGAIFFLLNFGKALAQLSQIYSNNKLLWWTMRLRITLGLIGDGIKRLISSHKTWYGKLTMLLLSPFYLVLTIFRIIWTLIKKKSRS